jgi:HlyD family secretion protein
MKPRTYGILAIAALAAVAVAAFGYDRLSGGVEVVVAEAEVGPVAEYVDEQAKTRLPKTYLIAMPYEGRIQPITLEEGEEVREGQVVAQVVPEDLAIRVLEARAAVERLDASIRENADTSMEETSLQQSLKFLESMDQTVKAAAQQVKAAEAKLTFANKEIARFRVLAGREAASTQDLNRAERDQVQAEVEYRQSQLVDRSVRALHAATALLPPLVRQYIDRKALKGAVLAKEKAEAEARLEQALLDQKRGTMVSPVDGVVLAREVESERLLSPGAELLEIGRISDLEVEAEVLTQEAVRVAAGQPVEILGAAAGPVEARGVVRKTLPAGFTKVSSLGVEQQRVIVLIAFDSESMTRLRMENRVGVGYRLRVRIITDERPSTLRIPRAAAFRGVDGGWRAFVVRGGRARLQPIEIGLENDEWIEVRRGLSTGDRVIPAPEADLADGTKVRAVGTDG